MHWWDCEIMPVLNLLPILSFVSHPSLVLLRLTDHDVVAGPEDDCEGAAEELQECDEREADPPDLLPRRCVRRPVPGSSAMRNPTDRTGLPRAAGVIQAGHHIHCRAEAASHPPVSPGRQEEGQVWKLPARCFLLTLVITVASLGQLAILLSPIPLLPLSTVGMHEESAVAVWPAA